MSTAQHPHDMSSEREYPGTELMATAHARHYNRWILARLSRHLGRVVVEVGSGRGSFTAELLRAAPERLVAIEPAPSLFAALQQAFAGDRRVELHHADLPELAGALRASADAVVYVNVLEHIADHARDLRAAHEVLQPSGRLCLFVPALPWLMSRFDQSIGHHRRYTRGQLRALVEGCGFEVVEARYFDLLGVLAWAVAFKLLRTDMSQGRVEWYDRLAVPLARLLDRLTGPFVGKSVLLVARKRD